MNTATEEYFRPADIQQMLRHAKPDGVYALIHSGELPASDVSLTPGTGKPRYVIARTDWLAFLERRRVAPPPKEEPRRRREPVEQGRYK